MLDARVILIIIDFTLICALPENGSNETGSNDQCQRQVHQFRMLGHDWIWGTARTWPVL